MSFHKKKQRNIFTLSSLTYIDNKYVYVGHGITIHVEKSMARFMACSEGQPSFFTFQVWPQLIHGRCRGNGIFFRCWQQTWQSGSSSAGRCSSKASLAHLMEWLSHVGRRKWRAVRMLFTGREREKRKWLDVSLEMKRRNRQTSTR